MKKKLIAGLFLSAAFTVFAQRVSTVAVFPFEAIGSAAPNDAAAVTRQIITELSSWGTLSIVGGDQAGNADYLIRGRLSRTNAGIILTATTFEARSERSLNTAREQGATLNELSGKIFSFCAQAVENVPLPNYLLGKWRAVINLNDGPLVCILEFKSDRTVTVEQYDTYEHRDDSVLKYQGFGRGTYSYQGHVRRMLALKDAKGVVYRETPVDGSVSISLTLEDALPKYGSLSQNRISLAFNEAKTGFELVSAGLACGDNFSGPAVYPQTTVAYTQFTKIQ
jgi:TolB-like protein